MLTIILIVFILAFAVTALLVALTGAGASKQLQETLERLDAVAATSKQAALDEVSIVKREELLSSIPWIDRWLRTVDVFGRVRLLLAQADLQWTAGAVLLASLGCGALGAVLVFLQTSVVLLSLLLGALAACIPWLYVLQKRSRRFAAFEEGLPEALDLIVSALRAGHGLTSAIGTVGKEMPDPIGKEFKQCFEEQNFGLELRTAMMNLAARVPIQDVRIIGTAIMVQKESGGNLAEVLDKVATIIRERFRLKREIRVRTAQGRLTGWILACLPLIFGIAIFFVRPDQISLLWKRPVGLKLLYSASVMTVIGALIIRKIVNIRI